MALPRLTGSWFRRRMVAVGVIPGPDDRAGPQHGAGLTPLSWFVLCIGGWTTMFGALMASGPLIEQPAFVLKIGGLLVVAFPTAYYLYFSRISRWRVNTIVFLAAVGLGVLDMVLTWPAEGSEAFYGLTASYRVLVKGFLWVMAFRAFAIRELRDMVLSAIPAMSCIILVMVAMPSALAVVGAAMVIVGSLFLLAAEYRADEREDGLEALTVRQVIWERGPRSGATLNTWQAVSVVVLIAAIVASAGASYMQASSAVGRSFRDTLARYLAGFMITQRADFSPDPLIWLTGETPSESSRVLFVVECDRGENWRQQAYADYNGRSWQIGRERRDKTKFDGTRWIVDTDLIHGFRRQEATRVKQVFRVQAPFAASLPGLFCAAEVKAPVSRIRVSRSGVIHCAGYIRPGQSYEVVSLVPAEGPAPRENRLPPLDPELRQRYLALPPELPARVARLARQITVQARNEFDAATMIRQYLVDNYVYDLHPDTRPREADFVDHFLFEAKSGYCMHYASAMAILCRCIGIPTRFVTGFVPGELDIETDTYEVQAKDAHSWVEAYIEGRGWQSFDPTPPQDEDDDKGFFAAQWAKLTKMLPGLFEPGGGLERAGRWALWALGLIALVAAAAAGGKHWRLYYRLRLDPRRATPEERVRFVYGQLLHWTEHFGLPRRESEPPLEFLDRLRAAVSSLSEPLARITSAFLRARYGESAVSPELATAAEEDLAGVHRALFRERALSKKRPQRR